MQLEQNFWQTPSTRISWNAFSNTSTDCRLDLWPAEGGGEICWCRRCRRRHVPGPYGWPAEEWPAHQIRSCCKDRWLSGGWFCRWCGRDEQTGREQASWGIYGSGYNLGWCECGLKFCQRWNYLNWSSCGSCWMVVTHQLVKFFLKLIGPWAEVHDLIFKFLVDSPTWVVPPSEREHPWVGAESHAQLWGLL